ncbi:MAG: hypothetical protein E7049_02865 [Lentisphaerae bacterium]|nr:hypothetical protein [Lentisphaerota bacterium]
MTLNVDVVPGLYYAADSAATIEALKRPSAAEPAKTGDAVVVPKQAGSQGFPQSGLVLQSWRKRSSRFSVINGRTKP